MAYYLFVNNATFSCHATLSQIIAFSTTKADYDDDMSEGGCQSQIVTLACVQ